MDLTIIAWWVAIGMISLWFIISLYVLIRGWININVVNIYIMESIPSVFSTLGVFGTFLGIAAGLEKFDVDDIEASIPSLLSGMKTAFWTSIIGIFLGVISAKFVATIKRKWDRAGVITSEEVQKLADLIQVIKESNDENKRQFAELRAAISSSNDDSLSTHFVKLRQQTRESGDAMLKALGGDGETSLLTQIQRMREEQLTIGKETGARVDMIKDTVLSSQELIARKFDEFTTLMEKSNTEALVKAIENVIGGFNDKLSELIDRLVKENFEELNRSVKSLNDWQRENKEQVATLIAQFKDVSERLQISAQSVSSIATSTDNLVNNDSILVQLVKELEDVLIKETNLRQSMELLNVSTKEMQQSSSTLSQWIEREKTFAESVGRLIQALKEIEELRNNASGFWADLKNRMNEGVGVLKEGNEEMKRQVGLLERSFQERMNQSFISLDKVLQAMVVAYQNRANDVLGNRR
ncbi:MAG TPA: MotA/TolQ/ExbB proton channel family protein [Flavobacteriales bacterium]|nr:MotA/TolQ/ExbB proton channel family protein [Flavobacteriales bacterium]